jgi:hypothetical protein
MKRAQGTGRGRRQGIREHLRIRTEGTGRNTYNGKQSRRMEANNGDGRKRRGRKAKEEEGRVERRKPIKWEARKG